MSDHGRRIAGAPGWVWAVVALFAALLAVNLAMTVFADHLPDVLSAKRVQALAFWGGWCVAAAACVAGWMWTGRALERSDRDGTRRLRTGFVFALTWVVILAIATFEDTVQRPHLAAVAAAVLALSLTPFALAARALADGGPRRRRRHRPPDDAE